MLWVPEFLAAEEYSFSYSDREVKENHVYSHLEPAQLKTAMKLDQVNLKRLQDRRIRAYSHADERVLSNKWWSVYDCIIFEHKLGDRHFILTEGEWKAVAGDFYKSVVEFAATEVRQETAEALYAGISIFDAATGKIAKALQPEACTWRPQSILFDQQVAHRQQSRGQRILRHP